MAVYRRPFPRGDFVEMLNIDDHTCAQLLREDGSTPSGLPRRDLPLFDRCDTAYGRAGLVAHPNKQIRGARHHTMVGCEIDGDAGFCSAPLLRITGLMRLSLLQLHLGVTEHRIFSTIISSWVSVFMYRRPLLCTMVEVFRFLEDMPQEGSVAIPLRWPTSC